MVHTDEEHGRLLVVCDVGRIEAPCMGTVETLARLALVARQGGGEVVLVGVSDDLRSLLALAGLDDRMRLLPASPSV